MTGVQTCALPIFNKCGFLVCRLVDAETIPTSISQQDKLKLNQAQPPNLHHFSHLYHPSPPCTPSLLVHHLSRCHHSNPTCTPSFLVHFLNHGQALLGHLHHTRPTCTAFPAQVHYTSTPCTALPYLFHHSSSACIAPVQVHTRPR